MICVRLEGGLGNQLFQYAAARALALRHRTELLLDTSTLLRYTHGVTPRNLELHRFRHAGRAATARESRLLPWLRRAAAVSHWLSPWRTFVEKGLNFNAAFLTLPDQTYLVGYWQSFRYFEAIAQQLMQEIEPLEPLSPVSAAVAEQIDSSMSVALHVRRGDYTSLAAAAALHGVLPVSYYEAALQRVRDRIGAPRFFVFSDDMDWCRANLPLPAAESTFVSHNIGPDAWQDLVLLSRCRHHVIANSSFSWWGAWLADQRLGGASRCVIAPSRWFSAGAEYLGDRFPTHWTVMQ